jgi:hypothetical protein
MFGVCRYASTCVAGILHAWKFAVANLDRRCTAESGVEFLTGWVAEVTEIVCSHAAVLTCIGHCLSPIDIPYIYGIYYLQSGPRFGTRPVHHKQRRLK